MIYYFPLRATTLAFMILTVTSCGQRKADPQPTKPAQVVNRAKQHPVALRYYIKPLNSSAVVPTTPPNITVEYERVFPQGSLPYRLLEPSPQFHDQEVTSAVKVATLPPIPTYAETGAIKPRITVTMWTDEVPTAGSDQEYEVISELLIDGQVASSCSFKAVAGLSASPYVIKQTEVTH